MKPTSRQNLLARLLGVLLILTLLAPLAPAQDVPANDAKEIEEEVTVLSVYKQGGWMMHILLICSIGTIAVVVYCSIQISPKKLCPKPLNDTLVRHMQARDVATAYAVCESNQNCLTRIVSSALLKVNFERDRANKDAMDQAAGEALDQEETRQMLWINYLNVFATIAPMIGLLGTVTGMIGSFADLKKGATDPNDFAGGIGEAMATTAGGLIVGIPAMFFYFFFRNRLLGAISEVQKRVSFLIDVVSGEVTLSDSSASAE